MTEIIDKTPAEDATAKNSPKPAPRFRREQLINAGIPGFNIDAASALLKDGELYTREQADSIINAFLNKEVL